MLYLAQLYCPCHTKYLQIFDNNTFKPCIGLCGHTVCLACIEENVHMACPICNRPDVFVNKTPNYVATELIKECRDNFWKLLENWWRDGNIDYGICSKCSDQSRVLRICLTCDENDLCITFNSERRLRMLFDRDLFNLSRHVLCSECAINHHNEHQTIKIEKIKYSKNDIKVTTSKIILELFRQAMDTISYTNKCRLRHKRIETIGSILLCIFWTLDYKEEGECGYLGELVTLELISKYIEEVDRRLKELKVFSTGETLCECNRLYDMLTGTRTETPAEQVTPEAFNDVQCPMCVILDFNKHEQKPIEFYRQNWLEVVENYWKNGLPSFSEFCFRCLNFMKDYQFGRSCGEWKANYGSELIDMKKEDEEKRFRSVRERTERELRNMHFRSTCQKPDCMMKDSKFWKYAIIHFFLGNLARILKDGCSHQSLSCRLKKIRLESTAELICVGICKMELRKVSREESSLLLENVDDALENLKNRKSIYAAANQGPTCICSKLWNRNQKILRKLGNESNKKREPYLKFEESMEEMAKYSLMEEIPGCPMDFNHGIVLDPIVLEELEEMEF